MYLLEGHPRTLEWLWRRVELSELRNVTIIPVAVSDKSETMRMSDVEDHMVNQSLNVADGIEVLALPLPAIFAAYGITHVDFLSMNIEGAERPALAALGEIAGRIERLAVSCHGFLADRGEAGDR